MAQSIKLGDDNMALFRREVDLLSRSVAGQITRGARISRAIGHSGNFDHARITAALEGRLDSTDLRAEEEGAWLDGFVATMGEPSQAEQECFATHQSLGRGVGLDDAGNLVDARGDSAA